MSASLPNVGGDIGRWGTELNEYLLVAHNADGTDKNGGASITALAGSPSPSGDTTGATDTAAVQEYFDSLSSAGGTAWLLAAGTYHISSTLTLPAGVSLVMGPTTTLKAANPFTGVALLQTPQSTLTIDQSISGGIIDGNDSATYALWVRYFQRFAIRNLVVRNAQQNDVVIGDQTAPLTSYDLHADGLNTTRTTGSVGAAGGNSLWIQNATDGQFFNCILYGHETSVFVQQGDNKFTNVHTSNYLTYPLQGVMNQNGRNEFHACTFDSFQPLAHGGASGTSSSATITDSAIRAQHQGLPVTGTNIPAGSYVGAVTSGTSFTLVDASGNSVNPTGTVSGITLAGVGLNNLANNMVVAGGLVIGNSSAAANSTYGVSNGPSGSGSIFGLAFNGNGTTFEAAITGNTSRLSWLQIQQNNCTVVLPTANVGGGTIYGLAGKFGLKAWTADPRGYGNSLAPATQTVYASAVYLDAGATIADIVFDVIVAGSGTAPTHIYAGIASASQVLAISSDLASSSIWTAGTGFVSAPLTSTYAVPASGIYYLFFYKSGTFGTTDLQLLVNSENGLSSAMPPNSVYTGFAVGGISSLAVSTSLTPTSAARAYWMAAY